MVQRITLKYPYANLPDTFPDLLWNHTVSAVTALSLFNHLPTIQLSIAGRYSTATAVIGICLNYNCISIYINQKVGVAQCLHLVGVGPMFTFYISPKMHKNLLSPPNHLIPLILLFHLLILSLHIVTLASVSYGQVSFAIFIT